MPAGTPHASFVVRRGAAWTLAILSGCASAPPPPSPAQDGSHSEPSREPVAATVVRPSTAAPSPTSLVRSDDVGFSRGSVLVGPFPERMDRAEIARSKWRRIAGPSPAWLALDQHAPRAFSGNELSLGDLLNEDEELAPGSHRIVAVRREASGFAVEEREFWLEISSAQPREASCLLLSPYGTINGEAAADALELVVLPLGSRESRIRVRLNELVVTEATQPGAALVLRPHALASGDFDFQVGCLDASGRELDLFTRTITVNRDAPVPQKQP